jgi:hypothetical protein
MAPSATRGLESKAIELVAGVVVFGGLGYGFLGAAYGFAQGLAELLQPLWRLLVWLGVRRSPVLELCVPYVIVGALYVFAFGQNPFRERLAERRRRKFAARMAKMPAPASTGTTRLGLFQEPRSLTYAEWLAAAEPERLLEHAVPRLSAQHTCLLLATIAERAWPAWHRLHPDDWRFALSVATLRAWCLGEASLEDLGEVKRATHLQRGQFKTRDDREIFARSPTLCGLQVIWNAMECARTESKEVRLSSALASLRAVQRLALADDAKMQGALIERRRSWWHRPTDEERWSPPAIDTRAVRKSATRRAASLSRLILRCTPFPSRDAMKWRRVGTRIRSGDGWLRLDGWRIAGVTLSLAPAPSGRSRR